MADGGARLVQIRDKRSASGELYEAAVEAVRIARERGLKLIVNDRVDIALLAGADGVHLGQRDISPIHARRLLGPEAVIGYSTHNLEQARAAIEMPIDYLAFGPVFPTSTKEDPDPVVGLEQLSEIKAIAADLPLVAIGGIDQDNVNDVLRAGADSAAVISAILSHPDGVRAGTERIIAAVRNTNTVYHI